MQSLAGSRPVYTIAMFCPISIIRSSSQNAPAHPGVQDEHPPPPGRPIPAFRLHDEPAGLAVGQRSKRGDVGDARVHPPLMRAVEGRLLSRGFSGITLPKRTER
jgi:hypothetical protein